MIKKLIGKLKTLRLYFVMKRISDLKKEYLKLPNKDCDEKIKWIRKDQIELVFDELGLDLPQIIMKGDVRYVS
jgi:hypothetical protein